jgi:aspartate 1-decarboxylase
MLREALFAKIHRATVTLCNPDYMGSITIDPDLLDAVGMRVNEKVLVDASAACTCSRPPSSAASGGRA